MIEIKLPSGASAEISRPKGRHVMEATKIIAGDQSLYMFALIALCTKIDGRPLVLEDVAELDGADLHELMAEMGNSLAGPKR